MLSVCDPGRILLLTADSWSGAEQLANCLLDAACCLALKFNAGLVINNWQLAMGQLSQPLDPTSRIRCRRNVKCGQALLGNLYLNCICDLCVK